MLLFACQWARYYRFRSGFLSDIVHLLKRTLVVWRRTICCTLQQTLCFNDGLIKNTLLILILFGNSLELAWRHHSRLPKREQWFESYREWESDNRLWLLQVWSRKTINDQCREENISVVHKAQRKPFLSELQTTGFAAIEKLWMRVLGFCCFFQRYFGKFERIGLKLWNGYCW